MGTQQCAVYVPSCNANNTTAGWVWLLSTRCSTTLQITDFFCDHFSHSSGQALLYITRHVYRTAVNGDGVRHSLLRVR